MELIIKDINEESVISLSSVEIKASEPVAYGISAFNISIKTLVEKDEYILNRNEATKLAQAINSGII